jgi:hypothetical protein
MTATIHTINGDRPPVEQTSPWEFIHEAAAANLRAKYYQMYLREFSGLVAEYALRRGDAYLAQWASAVLERIERDVR